MFGCSYRAAPFRSPPCSRLFRPPMLSDSFTFTFRFRQQCSMCYPTSPTSQLHLLPNLIYPKLSPPQPLLRPSREVVAQHGAGRPVPRTKVPRRPSRERVVHDRLRQHRSGRRLWRCEVGSVSLFRARARGRTLGPGTTGPNKGFDVGVEGVFAGVSGGSEKRSEPGVPGLRKVLLSFAAPIPLLMAPGATHMTLMPNPEKVEALVGAGAREGRVDRRAPCAWCR